MKYIILIKFRYPKSTEAIPRTSPFCRLTLISVPESFYTYVCYCYRIRFSQHDKGILNKESFLCQFVRYVFASTGLTLSNKIFGVLRGHHKDKGLRDTILFYYCL